MIMMDDDDKKYSMIRAHNLGADVESLSVAAIKEIIAEYHHEITRLEQAIKQKNHAQAIAQELFKS